MAGGHRVEEDVGKFRAQHLDIAERAVTHPAGSANVLYDEAESPLSWLARRKGRDGKALVLPHQLQAGRRAVARRFHTGAIDAAHDIELDKSVAGPEWRRKRCRAFLRHDGRGAPARPSRA